ncbi:hypothetical protein KIPB_010332 [Kipferlia bialata]|uniref:Uncharacterized protein n=1 Tax=Kipferlia bialata TaxID=797122 RepID=A0A9K3D306_9EUKA|nr:hypothetical protein KIPB_010332 [Kipferlia bialata]|eukprot:g10332.t1
MLGALLSIESVNCCDWLMGQHASGLSGYRGPAFLLGYLSPPPALRQILTCHVHTEGTDNTFSRQLIDTFSMSSWLDSIAASVHSVERPMAQVISTCALLLLDLAPSAQGGRALLRVLVEGDRSSYGVDEVLDRFSEATQKRLTSPGVVSITTLRDTLADTVAVAGPRVTLELQAASGATLDVDNLRSLVVCTQSRDQSLQELRRLIRNGSGG